VGTSSELYQPLSHISYWGAAPPPINQKKSKTIIEQKCLLKKSAGRFLKKGNSYAPITFVVDNGGKEYIISFRQEKGKINYHAAITLL